MTKTYYIECECGDKPERDFEKDISPGILMGFKCPGCGKIHMVRFPGRRKHTRGDTEDKELTVFSVFAENGVPQTVRQVFYALTVRGAVPKDDKGYRRAQYLLARMRRTGALPYGWITDNTRWQRKPTTYSGLRAGLEIFQDAYRRDLWANQASYVEIWVEKDALAGVVYPITSEFDVPLLVARGFSSMTFVYDTAESMRGIHKPIYVYHFGDFDSSGVSAAEDVRNKLQEYGAEFHFERVAVTFEQIGQYNLATRPNKKSDPRAKKWPYPYSCELDSMPANLLRQLVAEVIEKHMDKGQLMYERFIENAERQTLANVLENLERVPKVDS